MAEVVIVAQAEGDAGESPILMRARRVPVVSAPGVLAATSEPALGAVSAGAPAVGRLLPRSASSEDVAASVVACRAAGAAEALGRVDAVRRLREVARLAAASDTGGRGPPLTPPVAAGPDPPIQADAVAPPAEAVAVAAVAVVWDAGAA